jgi:hypothetical protein
VTNVPEGYDRWEPSGLPIDATTPPKRAYEDLLAVADAIDECT